MGAELLMNIASDDDFETVGISTGDAEAGLTMHIASDDDYAMVDIESGNDYEDFSFGEVRVYRTNGDSGGESCTRDYEDLYHKPRIEGVELIRNKTFSDLGLFEASKLDIEAILQS